MHRRHVRLRKGRIRRQVGDHRRERRQDVEPDRLRAIPGFHVDLREEIYGCFGGSAPPDWLQRRSTNDRAQAANTSMPSMETAQPMKIAKSHALNSFADQKL